MLVILIKAMKRFLSLLSCITFSALYSQNWTELSDCPGSGRFWAASFQINQVLYAGTGRTEFSGNATEDMWAYDIETDTWSQIADHPGGAREGCTGFSNGERGFIAFGSPFIQFTNTIHEYLPGSNEWVQKASCPASFSYSHGFVIDDNYYIGPENGTNKFYAYSIDNDSWEEKAPYPGQDRRAQVAFAAGGRGYIGMGAFVFGGSLNDFFAYTPETDSWSQIASISPASDQSSAFSINDEGYVSNVGGDFHQIFRYDAINDSWVFEASFPNGRIANATTCGINGKGYLVFGESTGQSGNQSSPKLWEFVPSDVSLKMEDVSDYHVFSIGEGRVEVRTSEGLPLLITAYSINGKLLHQQRLTSGSGQIQLPPISGVYLIGLNDEKGRETVKKIVL